MFAVFVFSVSAVSAVFAVFAMAVGMWCGLCLRRQRTAGCGSCIIAPLLLTELQKFSCALVAVLVRVEKGHGLALFAKEGADYNADIVAGLAIVDIVDGFRGTAAGAEQQGEQT